MITSGLTVVAALLLAGCTEQTPEQPQGTDTRLTVYSVNYPLHYFAQRIGGEDVDAVFPAPADVDPAYWMPAPDTIADYQDADLIFLNGAGYARWVGLATLREARMVDTSGFFTDRYIEMESAVIHTHGPRGDHSHPGFAFTTWLDMELAKRQARAITDALIEKRPGLAAAFETRYGELETDLGALDARLRAVARQLGDTPIVFSHPVYQYLQRRYGFNGRSVHWEANQTPTTRQSRELGALIASHGPRWMIWKANPLPEIRTALETRGISSLVFSPAASTPMSGDFLDVMDVQISALERAAAGQ